MEFMPFNAIIIVVERWILLLLARPFIAWVNVTQICAFVDQTVVVFYDAPSGRFWGGFNYDYWAVSPGNRVTVNIYSNFLFRLH